MLENNPMGSRRRRRFYHRIGVVPIPGDEINEYVEVPTSFFTDDPEINNDFRVDKAHTSVVSVSALLCRLLDIVNKMIALAEAEERDEKNEDDDDTSDSDDSDQDKSENEAEDESENQVKNESGAESQSE